MPLSTEEKYRDQGLDPEAEYIAECEVCGEVHEWFLDGGLGGAFGQGWLDCPEYGHVPVGKEDIREK